MTQAIRTIAVLVANPALGSVLHMVLAANPVHKVRNFNSLGALTAYMRISRVDMVIGDYDCSFAPADRVAEALKADAGLEDPRFQMIALTSNVTRELGARCDAVGIDEMVVKPMSPRYLLERVEARLAPASSAQPSRPRFADLVRPDFSRYANVVPLFAREESLASS